MDPEVVGPANGSERAGPRTLGAVAGSLARWGTLPALVVAVVGTAVHAILLHLAVVDDAAISIAYGHSLLSGAGLRLTPGSPPVEGFSNPLWVVLLGLSRPLGLEPLAFSRWLGVVLGALALVFVALAVPAASGRRLRPADAVGPLVVAASPNYAYWICSGMESGLHALLLAGSVWALVRDFRVRRGLTSGLLLAGLALTRPEAPLVIVVAAGFWMLWLFEEDRSPGRPEAILLGVLGLVACAYLAFRWAYFARLLPNTYFAKLRWDFRPARYLEGFARAYPLPLILAAGLGALGLLSRIFPPASEPRLHLHPLRRRLRLEGEGGLDGPVALPRPALAAPRHPRLRGAERTDPAQRTRTRGPPRVGDSPRCRARRAGARRARGAGAFQRREARGRVLRELRPGQGARVAATARGAGNRAGAARSRRHRRRRARPPR